MTERVLTVPDAPRTTALADLVARLGKVARGLNPAGLPVVSQTSAAVPEWLRARLTDQVGLATETVDGFSLEQAVDAWAAWSSHSR
jgi:hypothetical protein